MLLLEVPCGPASQPESPTAWRLSLSDGSRPTRAFGRHVNAALLWCLGGGWDRVAFTASVDRDCAIVQSALHLSISSWCSTVLFDSGKLTGGRLARQIRNSSSATLVRLTGSSDQFGADGVQDAGRHAQVVTCRRGRRAGSTPTDDRIRERTEAGTWTPDVLFLGESSGLRRCSGESLFFNGLRFTRNYRLCAINKLLVVGIDSTDARNAGHGNLALSVRSARDTRTRLAFKLPGRRSSASMFR